MIDVRMMALMLWRRRYRRIWVYSVPSIGDDYPFGFASGETEAIFYPVEFLDTLDLIRGNAWPVIPMMRWMSFWIIGLRVKRSVRNSRPMVFGLCERGGGHCHQHDHDCGKSCFHHAYVLLVNCRISYDLSQGEHYVAVVNVAGLEVK